MQKVQLAVSSSFVTVVPGLSKPFRSSCRCGVVQESTRSENFAHSTQWWDNKLDFKFPGKEHESKKDAFWIDNGNTSEWMKVAIHKESSDICDNFSVDAEIQPKSDLESLYAAGRLSELMDVLENGGIVASYEFYSRAMCKCGQMKALSEARRMHSYLAKVKLESDSYLGIGIVEMYVKCGSILDARHVFDKLSYRNVVSWNVMILGYAKKKEGELALQFFARMQREGVSPDDRTFVGSLKGCSGLAILEKEAEVDGAFVKVGCLEKGRAIHSQVVKCGFESNAYVGSTLIDMYTKCGSMVDARFVFDNLPHRNVVSWTVMILGYVERQECELALQLYVQMQDEGVAPNDRTFVGILKACSSLAALERGTEVDGKCVKVWCLEKGRSIHSQLVKGGFESDLFVGTTLVDMYVKCGSIPDACGIFGKLPHRDVVLWNALIMGYALNAEGAMALELYAQMLHEGVAPNERNFVGALKGCSSLAAQEEGTEVDGKLIKLRCLEKGRAIHSLIAKNGFESDAFVGNTLIDMYAKCGSMVDAQLVFEKLPGHDVVSWTAMILGCADQGESEQAFKLYGQMEEQGLSPNCVTFVSILKACGNTAALETGRNIHDQIRRAGLRETDMFLATALVDMYGKCGSMVDAQQVFDALSSRDLVIWSALIAGYARQGETDVVFRLFQRMREEGIPANGVAFLNVLTVCNHAGLVEKGVEYFTAMSENYGLTPTIEHYSCMVDLLGRAGQLDEAVAMVKKMPVQPDLVMWMTVLGGCRKWANVELGRLAFEEIVRLDKSNAPAYVLMSNIFADARMWEESHKIQAMKEIAGAWKKPGQSWWTESSGAVHTFMVGDTKHPQCKEIYAKLKDLFVIMEEEGYVPDMDSVLWDISDDKKGDALCGHSERLAIACALINTPPGTPIRVVKNLRVCVDCHEATAHISKIEGRQIICRDASRFHVYKDGKCSCGDYW